MQYVAQNHINKEISTLPVQFPYFVQPLHIFINT
jgi:hypothetical protein